MKNILIVLIIFLSNTAYSQNLQFNQVINFKRSLFVGGNVYAASTISDSLVVPANKVWKVEFASRTTTSSGQWCNPVSGGIIIDTYNFIDMSNFKSPLWIPAGGKISYYMNSGGANSGQSCSGTWACFFASIIEFNIQ